MNIKLSVLICTLPTRTTFFETLMNCLNYQLKVLQHFSTEIEILTDNRVGVSTGAKRNSLLERSSGLFVVFIDDDDMVSLDYLYKIMEAIYINPNADCIGMEGYITENGTNKKHWTISMYYGSWFQKDDVYYRTPNHISPIKREIAIKAGFPDIYFGEDAEYSKAVLPFLKTETYIPEEIYYYHFVTNKPESTV